MNLLPLPWDWRDNKFKFSRLFGVAPKETLGTLVRSPRKIEDQRATNFCTAAAVSTASEFQEGEDFSLEYQIAKIGFLMGAPVTAGAHMRKALQSVTAYGSLRVADSPFHLSIHRPEVIADWKNWPKQCDDFAKKFRKAAYSPVDKPWGYDWFDAVRSALKQGEAKNQVIVAGTKWYWEWDALGPTGILPKPQNYKGLHAYVIHGYDNDYLICQNSYGEHWGTRGVFRMSREIANEVFAGAGYNGTGLFVLTDLDDQSVENLRAQWTSLYDVLMDLLLRARYGIQALSN